jgi:hypothetical protein
VRLIRSVRLLLPLAAMGWLAAAPAWTQDAPGAEAAPETPSDAPAAEDAPAERLPDEDTPPPPDGVHPATVSPVRARAYAIKPKKLWAGLLATLREAGYVTEEIDEAKRSLRTEFREFKDSEYSEEVAERPPFLGRGYHILQTNRVKQGRASIEASIEPRRGGGSDLRLRARILVQGLDRRRSVRVMTDRRSSGVIEDDLFGRVEQRLGLERLPAETAE